MKTTTYNPSPIEVEFAKGLSNMKNELEKHLSNNKIDSIVNKINADNPMIIFNLVDGDGDTHQLVIKVIQRPDPE